MVRHLESKFHVLNSQITLTLLETRERDGQIMTDVDKYLLEQIRLVYKNKKANKSKKIINAIDSKTDIYYNDIENKENDVNIYNVMSSLYIYNNPNDDYIIKQNYKKEIENDKFIINLIEMLHNDFETLQNEIEQNDIHYLKQMIQIYQYELLFIIDMGYKLNTLEKIFKHYHGILLNVVYSPMLIIYVFVGLYLAIKWKIKTCISEEHSYNYVQINKKGTSINLSAITTKGTGQLIKKQQWYLKHDEIDNEKYVLCTA